MSKMISAVLQREIGGGLGGWGGRTTKKGLPHMGDAANKDWVRGQQTRIDNQEFNQAWAGGSGPVPGHLSNNADLVRPTPVMAREVGGGGKPPTNSPAAEVAAAGGGAHNNIMENGLFAGFNDSVQGGFGHVLAGGMIGGVGSYATGGEFGQGFAMGTVGGFGVRQMHRSLGSNSAMWQSRAERFATSDKMGSKRMAGLLDNVNTQGSAHSLHTMNQRKAMYMGAGLMGVMGGGDRNSHKRGFNSHRGNTF